jgi:hypothetical protein
MKTQKVAITIPIKILSLVDSISRKMDLSRSKYISILLEEKLSEVMESQLKEAYDRVFSDDSVRKEQIKMQANPLKWNLGGEE